MATIKKDTIVLADENGCEILASYEAEKMPPEDCHGTYYPEGGWCVTLTGFEIVVAGTGIEMLIKLNDKQKEKIIKLICDEL